MKKFDFNSITDFDNHIDLSIPNYSFLIEQVQYLIECYVDEYTNMIDIGCSTGSMLNNLNHNQTINYYGYDISNIMPSNSTNPNVHFINLDILNNNFIDNCSVISSIFTIQFLPRNLRHNIIDKIYNSLNTNGIFIMCEKTYSENPSILDITNSIYYKYKMKNFNSTDILSKQQQLAISMKMNTVSEIYNELHKFKHVEIFWKSYGFTGFIAIK